MTIHRRAMGLLVVAAFYASSSGGALAKAITYTFTATGDITGSLGGVAIGADDTLTFTAVGDTLGATSFDLGGGAPHGWTNPATTATITVTNNTTHVSTTGTFTSADGIFVSIDNANGGVGFGSGYPSFPGDPVYPFGIRPCSSAVGGGCGATQDAVLSYNLQTDVTFTAPSGMENPFVGPGGLSCFGFPGSCTASPALATSAGALVLGAAGPPFSVTDSATFNAKVMSTPEPSTWAMMAFGFAGLGLIGYRQTRKSRAAAA